MDGHGKKTRSLNLGNAESWQSQDLLNLQDRSVDLGLTFLMDNKQKTKRPPS